MPVMRTPDEDAHILQSYILADGQLLEGLTAGRVSIPENAEYGRHPAKTTLTELWKHRHETVSQTYKDVELPIKTAIYPPLSYAPQAIGMRITMLFTDHLLPLYYSARLANWLLVLLIVAYTWRILPWGRGLFLALLLLPLNMQQMISASADGVAIALVYCLTAFVLHHREQRKALRPGDYMIMLGLSVGLSCWKVFYFPMVFLFLLLPVSCFRTRSRKVVSLSLIIGSSLALLAGWMLVCYSLLFRGASTGLTGQTMTGLSAFLASPLDFAVKLGRNLKQNLLTYFYGVWGYPEGLSWFNINPGKLLALLSAGVTFLCWQTEPARPQTLRSRAALLGWPAVCTLLVFFMLYVWWTPGDAASIEGFQARYLLPLLLPVMLAGQRPRTRFPWLQKILLPGACLVYLGYLYRIIQHTW